MLVSFPPRIKRERERRENRSAENGKMHREYDVLVLARDDRFLLPGFFKCRVPIRALSI
jgi:hypothetical protein